MCMNTDQNQYKFWYLKQLLNDVHIYKLIIILKN